MDSQKPSQEQPHEQLPPLDSGMSDDNPLSNPMTATDAADAFGAIGAAMGNAKNAAANARAIEDAQQIAAAALAKHFNSTGIIAYVHGDVWVNGRIAWILKIVNGQLRLLNRDDDHSNAVAYRGKCYVTITVENNPLGSGAFEITKRIDISQNPLTSPFQHRCAFCIEKIEGRSMIDTIGCANNFLRMHLYNSR